jgi:hypothetical protein
VGEVASSNLVGPTIYLQKEPFFYFELGTSLVDALALPLANNGSATTHGTPGVRSVWTPIIIGVRSPARVSIARSSFAPKGSYAAGMGKPID